VRKRRDGPAFLPTSRAIAIALVGGTAIAAVAPPGAAVAIVALAAAVWIAARADAARARNTFTLERSAPARIAQGDRAAVAWTVRAGPDGVRALVLTEAVPDTVEIEGLPARFRVPADGLAQARGTIRPRRRGTFRLGPAAARALGPRGLGWARVHPADAVEVRVDPPVEPLRRLSLDSSRTRRQGGAVRRLRGVGSEFESLRDYRPDDDSRWIDWKATARRRRLTSREYQVDEHQSVVFLVDTGRLMATEDGERSKLDHALGAALAIGWAAMTRGDNVGLLAFDRGVKAELRPGRGAAQTVRMHEALGRLQPSLVEPDYEGALARLQQRVRKRSLVLVFTDLVDERVSADLIRAVALAGRRHLVIVVTLSDRELVDRLARPPATAREAYGNAVAADALLLRDAAVRRLKRSGVRVVDSPADRLAADAVEAYLRVRRENRV
jgi:uncharacterized protein (DUF58 family)